MDRIESIPGALRTIRVDNGPEFISNALDRRAYENGVTLDLSRLANRPTTPSLNPSMAGSARNA